MKKTTQEIQELFKRYMENTCTPEEKQFFENWYASEFQQQPDVSALLDDPMLKKQQIWERLRPPQKKKRNTVYWQAAAVLLSMATLTILYFTYPKSPSNTLTQQTATLRLGNGKVIDLDQLTDGNISGVPGITIRKINGRLIYQTAGDQNTPTYNTLTTPAGKQYELWLPDGTKVVLNAATSITFPTRFTGVRKVTLRGEAYFEVAKNAGKPFQVFSLKQIIHVLGTHFNASCYFNELSVTTLAEGKVMVYNLISKKNQNLIPGQQAILQPNGDVLVKTVDSQEASSWKDGVFVFHHEPIGNVLARFSRWYDLDVDVNYNTLQHIYFDGEIPMNVSASDALSAISVAIGKKLTIEERRIVLR